MQSHNSQIIVSINKEEFIIPQHWNELSNQQIFKCYLVIKDARLDSLFPADEALEVRRIEIMKVILDLKEAFLKGWEEDAGDDFYDELRAISRTVSAFAFTPADEDGAFQLQINLTRNPIPHLPFKGIKYYPPADELDNITLYELGQSFLAFENFMSTGAAADAARLVAILYRPGKPQTKANLMSDFEGDRRLPLYKHETTIKGRADLFQKNVPEVAKQLIIFWFASCRQAIIDAFPNIFQSEAVKGDDGKNDYSWAGVILNLADGIVNEETVSNKNYGTALTYLSMLEDRRKEQELNALLNSKT